MQLSPMHRCRLDNNAINAEDQPNVIKIGCLSSIMIINTYFLINEKSTGT
jgi:hypothetical protein